jgi:Arc/MetJ-type ribon-helix-helix transcriptional regulator
MPIATRAMLDRAISMAYCHTMPSAKIAITLDRKMLRAIDELVKEKVYPNRSRAIREAVEEKLSRLNRTRLARECHRLDKRQERAAAEEGFGREGVEWPEY